MCFDTIEETFSGYLVKDSVTLNVEPTTKVLCEKQDMNTLFSGHSM